jgi:hypothetical protein
MEPSEHIRSFEHVSMHERDVLFAIPIVPKSHDTESAEPRREIGNGNYLHTDVVRAETFAVVVLVTLDEVVEVRHCC